MLKCLLAAPELELKPWRHFYAPKANKDSTGSPVSKPVQGIRTHGDGWGLNAA